MEAFIVIDESTSRVINGTYQFDRDQGGVFICPSGDSFPVSPSAGELFWRTDEKYLYRRNNLNTVWEPVEVALPTIPVLTREMHKVTSGEVTQGYFELTEGVPTDIETVVIVGFEGIEQINKAIVGSTGVTPDYEVQDLYKIHINGNGGATGLSGDIIEDTILTVSYTSAA